MWNYLSSWVYGRGGSSSDTGLPNKPQEDPCITADRLTEARRNLRHVDPRPRPKEWPCRNPLFEELRKFLNNRPSSYPAVKTLSFPLEKGDR